MVTVHHFEIISLEQKNMKFHICLCVDPQAMIPQTSHVPVACSFFGRLHLAQGDAPRSKEQNPQMSCKYSMGPPR